MANANAQSQITGNLLGTHSLSVSQKWLSEYLSRQTSSSSGPLASQTKTIFLLILCSDIKKTLSPQNSNTLLPTDITDPNVKERRVAGRVPVQVLDIEDIGASVWSQVEALERVENGEQIRGREIIRTVTRDAGGGDLDAVTNNDVSGSGQAAAAAAAESGSSQSHGPHKLILEDTKGTRVTAVELKLVDGISIEKIPIGTKLLIDNATAARGMILLEPVRVTILGGKIETWDKEWKQQRKATMTAKLEQLQSQET